MTRDFYILVGAALAIFVAVGAIVLVVEQHAEQECVDQGGIWEVVGQHYQPPIYIHSGNVSIPTGGMMVDDYGCVGGRQ